MKVFILYSLLLVGIIYATDHDSSSSTEKSKCDMEIKRIKTETNKCVNDDTLDFFNIHSEINKVNNGETTEEDFNTFIGDFCPKALTGTRCGVEQIPTIAEECQTDDTVKVMKNMILLYNTMFERMCKDDGKGYIDIIKNNGVKCFMDNHDLNECWKTHGVTYMDRNNYKNHENMCKYIKTITDCSVHLDKCDNQDVKTILTDVNTHLCDKFKCIDY